MGEIDRAKLQQLAEGDTFGRYDIKKKLGSGGVGEVYLARDRQLDRPVVLKLLTKITFQNIERFYKEAKLIAKLNHPNVVRIYDVGEIDNVPYICREYVDATSLDDVKLSINEAVKITKEIAETLQYVHLNGILHRDIKPSNILITNDKHIYIIDFGIAKEMAKGAITTLSIEGMILGTPVYMSPEQAKGDIEQVDFSTDVYSLGATLYYLVTGTQPFSGVSTVDVLHKVINDDPKAPRKTNQSISKQLEMIILKAMQKDKRDRYPSMKVFADDLERFIEGKPVIARLMRMKKALRFKIMPIHIALLVILALLLYEGYRIRHATIAEQPYEIAMNHLIPVFMTLEKAKKLQYTAESNLREIQGHLKQCQDAVKSSLKIHQTPLAYFYSGRLHYELDNPARAMEDFSKVLEMPLAPTKVQYEIMRSDILLKLTRIIPEPANLPKISKSIKEGLDNNARQMDPADYNEIKRFLDCVEMILKNDPKGLESSATASKNEEVFLWASLAFFAKGDLDRSIEWAKKAITIRPHYAAAYAQLANCYNNLNKFDEAIQASNMVIQINPQNPLAYLYRGIAHHRQGNHELATEDFQRCLSLDPTKKPLVDQF